MWIIVRFQVLGKYYFFHYINCKAEAVEETYTKILFYAQLKENSPKLLETYNSFSAVCKMWLFLSSQY